MFFYYHWEGRGSIKFWPKNKSPVGGKFEKLWRKKHLMLNFTNTSIETRGDVLLELNRSEFGLLEEPLIVRWL